MGLFHAGRASRTRANRRMPSTAAPSEPSTARVERRHGNEPSIDQLLDHGLEIVVIEESGKVCSEPDRTKQTDAIVRASSSRLTATPSCSAPRHRGALRLLRRPSTWTGPVGIRRRPSRRPADGPLTTKSERRRQAARTRLLEAHVVASESEHTVVHGDEKLSAQQLRPAATADARVDRVVRA